MPDKSAESVSPYKEIVKVVMAKKQTQKRKRGSPEPENEAVPSQSPPASPVSSEASEQSEQAILDSFHNDTAAPVEAFSSAAADATAFLQPSEQMSGLARQAAKVCLDAVNVSAWSHASVLSYMYGVRTSQYCPHAPAKAAA